MIKTLKTLLGYAHREDATVDELTPALPAAEAELASAREAADAAEAAYQAQLLTADDAAMRRIVEARTDASVRVDRAVALVAALGERLAAAREREAEADRVIAYEAARKQANEAREALAEFYPQFANGLADLLRAVAKAEIVVSEVNADLPRGVERLESVEGSVRDVPGTPRKLISEATVERWCRPGDRMPGTLDQSLVQVGRDGRGYLQPSFGPCEYLVLRRYKERRYTEMTTGNFAYSLAVSLNLPGLRADQAPIFAAADRVTQPTPIKLLKMLDEFAALAGKTNTPEPIEKVELELISAVDPENERRQTATLFDRISGRS